MRQNLNDPVIDEIREVQRRISARFDHDPRKAGDLLHRDADAEAVPEPID